MIAQGTVQVPPVGVELIEPGPPIVVEVTGLLDNPRPHRRMLLDRLTFTGVADQPTSDPLTVEVRRWGSGEVLAQANLAQVRPSPSRGSVEPAAPIPLNPGEAVVVAWRGEITKPEYCTCSIQYRLSEV